MKFENPMDNLRGNFKEVAQEKKGGELKFLMEQVGRKAKENPEKLAITCNEMEKIVNEYDKKYPGAREVKEILELSAGACRAYVELFRKEGHEIVFELPQ